MSGEDRLAAATAVVEDGGLVVYPTETVYGLGADALDPDAVESVFETKRRDRDDPLSLAVPTVEAALEYVRPSTTEEQFMREFLPGPVTVVLEGAESVPDVLTGGRERVGVRIPDHDLARDLLERTGPLTATSANVSGRPSVTHLTELDPEIRTAAGAILDGGETPGTASTVVDVGQGTIHRRGADADAVAAWLDAHSQ
ncbi:Sua5-YciO-YrdC-YwlC family protein [Halorhabdus tiamatea SARL4B]|uniref:L-threonylcarbamoyladenylate synthase n=1 Tax=Halorhabdus tiamatea SARL4B TaxID=1033806 RepID=S6D8K5_9EURY|nr:L-threonylcarbamoyladenylate synthase [Halorhabdus tiamatea]ERJ05356.1 Sua5-YciO-YrdC-YwlC family protein [Halorhabdus tiamatea SARL4B]CCQ33626.1 Sua5/YciO/YrdC/YwlC family protein [Halorhabdus tiamatea SARL4B]